MYQLNDLTLLGKGGYKLVYQHPTDESKAIKVMNPNRINDNGEWAHLGRFKRGHAQGVYKQFRREVLQYLQLCKNHYKHNIFSFPIETPYGFVETDQGLGLVVEKIISPNGNGITLHELCRTGEFNDTHAKALDEFFDACCDLHIVYGEVNIAGAHRRHASKTVEARCGGARCALPYPRPPHRTRPAARDRRAPSTSLFPWWGMQAAA